MKLKILVFLFTFAAVWLSPLYEFRAEGRADGERASIVAAEGTYIIKSDNSLWYWGGALSRSGRLANATSQHRLYAPTKIMDNVVSVSAGRGYTMAIRTDGGLYSWGWNMFGQLGDGTTIDRHTPVRIKENVVSVSAGNSHTAAILTDGSLWTWGSNFAGNIGNGTVIAQYTPIRIMENVVAVSVGHNNSMAIRADGSLWAWGENMFGQLGDGTITARLTPVRIMGNVVAVSVGGNHTTAISSDGSLRTWGLNNQGQLGDGTTTDRHTPTRVMSNVTAVSAGFNRTKAILSDGSLWAWGDNQMGRIGDGTITERHTPVRIKDNIHAVSALSDKPMAICIYGKLWAWGHSATIRLEDGSIFDSRVPVRVLYNITLPVDSIPPTTIPTPGQIRIYAGMPAIPVTGGAPIEDPFFLWQNPGDPGILVGMLAIRGFTALVGFPDPIWEAPAITIVGTNQRGQTVTVQILQGSNFATVNGVQVDIATFAGESGPANSIAPINQGGRLFLPLRFIANAFDLPINWVGGGVLTLG